MFEFATQQKKGKVQEFINPERILRSAPLTAGMTVADFGCGNGYYSVAAALIVGKKGQVIALDIMEDALSQTATLARLVGVPNVSTKQCDLEKLGTTDLPDTSCDLVIMSSLLHQVENKDNVLREAYRVLKTGGRFLVIEWMPEASFGPVGKDRLSKSETQKIVERFSFRPLADLPAGSFHYALLYEK